MPLAPKHAARRSGAAAEDRADLGAAAPAISSAAAVAPRRPTRRPRRRPSTSSATISPPQTAPAARGDGCRTSRARPAPSRPRRASTPAAATSTSPRTRQTTTDTIDGGEGNRIHARPCADSAPRRPRASCGVRPADRVDQQRPAARAAFVPVVALGRVRLRAVGSRLASLRWLTHTVTEGRRDTRPTGRAAPAAGGRVIESDGRFVVGARGRAGRPVCRGWAWSSRPAGLSWVGVVESDGRFVVGAPRSCAVDARAGDERPPRADWWIFHVTRGKTTNPLPMRGNAPPRLARPAPARRRPDGPAARRDEGREVRPAPPRLARMTGPAAPPARGFAPAGAARRGPPQGKAIRGAGAA